MNELSVKDRRAAALERLNAGPTRTVQSGPRKGQVRRAKPSRRAVPRVTAPSQQLGPPPRIYYAIFVVVATFVLFGLVMVLSATSARNVGGDESPYAIFQKQALWAMLGVLATLIVVKVPYQRWRTGVVPAAVLAGGAMLLPFAPGIGSEINDATSWVQFAGLSFQPSEFLKLAAIGFLADYFARHQDRVHIPRYGLWPMTIVAAGCAGVAFAQGDLGAAIVLSSIVLAIGVVAGIPLVHVAAVSCSGVVLAAMAIMSSPRRLNRFTAFRDIEGNKDHLAYQSWRGLVSIASGGLTGSGIGGSNSKLGYLPLAHSDFIFAVIADELGLVGSVAVIGGFMLLVYFGVQAALAAPDRFGMLLAGGISAWFGVQAIVNMGGVVGLMPVTGLTLPFFSAGGTSLFVSMLAAGLLLNVSRRAVTAPRADRTEQLRRPARRPARTAMA